MLAENSPTLRTCRNWYPPFQLSTLRLNSWHMGTELPQWIRQRGRLLHLEISNSRFLNTIPAWFFNLSSQLNYLNLSLNRLFHGCFLAHYIPINH